MPNITNLLNIIKNAIYGKDMRMAIHDAIDAVNTGIDDIKDSAGAPNGYATLGADGKVPNHQLPPESVTSVAGKLGDVELEKADVGLENVDNTADMDKPVSTAVQQALDDIVGGLTAHTDDTDIHITQQEREAWNDMTPKSHASETDEYGAGTEELYGHVRLANRLDVTEPGTHALDASAVQDILEQIEGAVSTVEISETVTGEPGEAAVVENVGTDKNVVLKFTIPRGPQGPQGEPGDLGPDGKVKDSQIGPRTITNPYTGEGTTEGLLTELLNTLSDAAQPWRTEVVISDTEPEEGPCLWFNTGWRNSGQNTAMLDLGNVTADTPIIAVVDNQQYGVANASVDGNPQNRAYDFKIN